MFYLPNRVAQNGIRCPSVGSVSYDAHPKCDMDVGVKYLFAALLALARDIK